MTVFGVIWLELLLCCFFAPNVSYLTALTIVSSVLQCSHVLLIGELAIGPQVITSGAFTLKMFLTANPFRIRIQKDAVGFQVGAFFIFLTAILSSLFNEAFNYIRLLQLWIYTLCFFYMFRAGRFVSSNFCGKLLKGLTVFLAAVGFLQLFITSGVLPRCLLIQELFYNDVFIVDSVAYGHNGAYFRVFSTYMEPSYYAPFLVGAFFYFLNDKNSVKKNEALLFTIAVQILLTLSSTAYAATVIIMAFFLLSAASNKKYKARIIMMGIVCSLLMYLVFFNVLDAVIFSKFKTDSGITRSRMNFEAQLEFLKSPIWGNGYKQVRGSSLFFSLLGQLGVLGLASYLLIIFPILRLLFSHKTGERFKNQYIGLSFAVLSVTVCQMIAIPDLDICSYWMWLNLLALSYYSREKRRGIIQRYG